MHPCDKVKNFSMPAPHLAKQKFFCSIYMEGGIDLGGTQYHNTVRKFGKYQNSVSNINDILILQLFSDTLT